MHQSAVGAGVFGFSAEVDIASNGRNEALHEWLINPTQNNLRADQGFVAYGRVVNLHPNAVKLRSLLQPRQN